MKIFCRIANSSASILCTVHQPSSQLFLMFDKVIFMKDGRIFYQGAGTSLFRWFEGFGYICPANFNVGDFAMEILQTESTSQLDDKGMFIPPPLTLYIKGIDASDESYCPNRPASMTDDFGVHTKATFSMSTFILECSCLMQRELTGTFRNRPALKARFGVTIFTSILLSIVFFRVGNGDNVDNQTFQTHNGAIMVVGVSAMMSSAVPTLLELPTERVMFLREIASGTYGAVPYFVSKGLLELPQTFIQNLLQILIVYWLMALNGVFIYFVLTTWLTALSASSLATIAGTLFPDPKQAMQVSPVLFLPQMLFAGFFISMSEIPSWLWWLQYCCGLKYGMNLLLINEFSPSLQSCQGDAEDNCRELLEDNDTSPDRWYISAIILIALFLGFRIVACIILAQIGVH